MFCQNKGWSPGSVWDGNPSCPTSQTWAQEDHMPIALKPPQLAFPACQPSHWAVSFQAFLPSEYCAEGRTGMSLQRGILLELGRGSSGAWQLTMEMGFSICPRLFPSLCRGGIFPFHYKSLTFPQKVRRGWPLMGQWESSLSFYACLLIAVLPLLLVAHGTTLFSAILLEKTSCKVWKLLALVIWTSSPREFPLAQKGLLICETSQSLWEVGNACSTALNSSLSTSYFGRYIDSFVAFSAVQGVADLLWIMSLSSRKRPIKKPSNLRFYFEGCLIKTAQVFLAFTSTLYSE